jgi:hypothetical protein
LRLGLAGEVLAIEVASAHERRNSAFLSRCGGSRDRLGPVAMIGLLSGVTARGIQSARMCKGHTWQKGQEKTQKNTH